MEQLYHKDFFLDMEEDVEMFDLLSLRRDQCLEYAKEYSSIIPEPLGSRLRPRHLSRTPSNTLNQRPVWKQPCKVPAPQSYSLQWQHIDLSQLEAFPSTLRGTGSPLPSRKRDQPDFTYNAPERPLDRIAAVTARTPTPHAQQQRTHALSHAGNHLATGTHESERTAEGMHSSPVKADRKADASSIMQHCTGSYARQSGLHHTHVINCLSDANGKLAQCQHATPAQPSSPALQPSLRRQKAAQHADTCSAKQSAAGCSHDSQTVKDITPTHSHKVQASTRRSGHEGKHDPMHAGTQSSCSQRYDPVGRSPGRGSCTPQRKAHEGSEGLQRQDTLLGNWVRWEKAAGAPVVSSPGHPQHKVERKVGSSSTPGLAPPTPPQPKEGQRGAAGHTTQPKQQLSPAFQRHVMPCTAKPVAQASTAHPQQTRRSGSPARQWQQEAPLPQTQQHSSKKTAVLDSVLHQPGCELDQRCNAEDGLDGGRWQPSVRYCLTSAEPAMGAGVWEEQATRQWLQELSLGLTASEESASLLENQLRNGVLLCDLAGVLEERIVWAVDRQPKSLQRARANIMAGLGQLGMLTAQTCPKGLVHEVEHILQGRQASIWGLLNHIRVTHPSAKVIPVNMRAQTADRTAAQTADRTTSQTADRTTAQTADRTTAQPVHLLKPDRCTVDIAGPQSQDAQHVVSIGPHGTIRCSVPGLASPRPTATAQHGGHQHDLHQSSRRVSPLRSKQQQGAKHLCPYHQRDTITVSLVNQPDLLTPPSRAVSPHRSQRGHTAQAATSAADAANTKGYVRMVAVGPGYCSPQATASAQCDRLYSSQPREQQQVHIGPRCCPDASAPAQCGKPCIRQPKGHQCQQQCPAEPERCPEPAAASPAGRKAALAQLRMTRRRQQSGVVSKQKVQECMAARQRQGPGQQWSSSRKAAEHSGPLNDLELVTWAQSKGLSQLSPGMLLEPSFADGRLLCRLVELLTRCSLPGIEWHGPSIAASRHNIAKAMAELKKKPSMSLQHLWQAANVVNSEPGCIQALLNDIVKAYR